MFSPARNKDLVQKEEKMRDAEWRVSAEKPKNNSVFE
jgi:hypothetical protein